MEEILKFRHNAIEIPSVRVFEQIKGGLHQNTRDVYFVRLLGDNGSLQQDVEQMDARLSAAMKAGRCIYQRMSKLPALTDKTEADYYSGCYEKWKQDREKILKTEVSCCAGIFPEALARACQTAVSVLAKSKSAFSESMQKNFVVKLLYWLDCLLKDFPQNWHADLNVKIVSHNIVQRQAYCFFYFLTWLGMDVLLIQSRQDIEEEMEQLKLSQSYRLGEWTENEFPAYHYENYEVKVQTAPKSSVSQVPPEPVRVTLPERKRKNTVHAQQSESASVRVTLPERNRRTASYAQQPAVEPARTRRPEQSHRISEPRKAAAAERREKSYEELASLASSVVLVGIHDNRGTLIGTGSGIMIGRKGYILTNNHVASGGCFYTVRIEEDDKVYETEEVIKYNSVLDLAVLRIDRTLQPLPVYSGSQKLVRGQRVVAIGSPLGLFNSVSDGIISGFRVIDDVDMIQFTAPISHGSSGGALLNLYGEVIGISTAGIDEGQNINLAVGYEGINLFIQGFTG